MDNLGRTLENTHTGNTEILKGYANGEEGDLKVEGDLIVEGDVALDNVIVNDLEVVNELKVDGYTLPTSAGTINQVITMNADGKTTDFKDAGGGITGYFYRNLFTMAEANTNFTANPAVINNLYTSGTGNLDLGSIDNFPINSTIKWYVRGRLDLTSNAGIVNADGRFQLTINENVIAPLTPINYFTDISSLSTGGTQPNSMFAIDICITRVAANSYRFNGYGQFSSGSTGTITMDWNDVLISPPIAYTTWQMKLGYYYLGVNIARPITETLTCDLIVDTSALIAAPPAPTSHTALTDLTLGDAGHTQFALLQGRSGGQILSGGITPLHDLKLKSHTAGLDNVVVKDLNTEFKKDIDMNGNVIRNLNNIDAGGGSLSITNTGFPALSVSGGINCNDSAFLYSCPSVYAGTTNLVLGSDIGGTEFQTGVFPTRQTEMIILPDFIAVSSTNTSFQGNNIIMGQGRIQDLKRVDGGGAGSNFIEMVDAALLGGMSIKSNVGINLEETITSNRIGINTGGYQSIVGNGQSIIQNTSAGNNIFLSNTIGGNIRLENTAIGGAIELEAEQIDFNYTTTNFKVRNGLTVNFVIEPTKIESFLNFICPSINSLTPVGGVYAGTSDGTLINNTTEQSVLPASGVGSLTIPANTFQVGDSFHCVVAGDCSFENKDEIQIKLKENGNILAQTPIFQVEDANAGDNAFEIEIDFTIRSIGVGGSIATNFDFTYNKDGTDSKDFRGTRAMDVQPIDTTASSTLEITAQFPTNVASSLQTRLFRLQKVY